MSAQVPIAGSPTKTVAVASKGEFDAAIARLTEAVNKLGSASAATSTTSAPKTTDGAQEGQYNLDFTAARAVNAIAAVLEDSDNITLSYAEGVGIKADLIATGVTAGTYGDGSNIPQITVDANGRITAITTVSAGGQP